MAALPALTESNFPPLASKGSRNEKHSRVLSIIKEVNGFLQDPEVGSDDYSRPKEAEKEKFSKLASKRATALPTPTVSPIPKNPNIQNTIEKLIESCENQVKMPPTPPRTPLPETAAEKLMRIHMVNESNEGTEGASSTKARSISKRPAEFIIQKQMSQKERKAAIRMAAGQVAVQGTQLS